MCQGIKHTHIIICRLLTLMYVNLKSVFNCTDELNQFKIYFDLLGSNHVPLLQMSVKRMLMK